MSSLLPSPPPTAPFAAHYKPSLGSPFSPSSSSPQQAAIQQSSTSSSSTSPGLLSSSHIHPSASSSSAPSSSESSSTSSPASSSYASTRSFPPPRCHSNRKSLVRPRYPLSGLSLANPEIPAVHRLLTPQRPSRHTPADTHRNPLHTRSGHALCFKNRNSPTLTIFDRQTPRFRVYATRCFHIYYSPVHPTRVELHCREAP